MFKVLFSPNKKLRRQQILREWLGTGVAYLAPILKRPSLRLRSDRTWTFKPNVLKSASREPHGAGEDGWNLDFQFIFIGYLDMAMSQKPSTQNKIAGLWLMDDIIPHWILDTEVSKSWGMPKSPIAMLI